MTISQFRELLHSSYKSYDTEENIDVYFTRPIGMFFALIWRRLGVHPNAITILSIFLGIGAGWMFHYTDLLSNIIAVLLLMFANFCDSTDGQLARMTGQKTLIGRMLDGFSSDVWFFCVYVALFVRMWDVQIPGTTIQWGIWGFFLVLAAGVIAHARQARLADYYRNIHLFFLLGKEGSELDSYENQRKIYEKYKAEKNFIGMAFFFNYANYCHAQEASTPEFQALKARLTEKYGGLENVPQSFRDEFREHSFPLMKYTNFLTHNWRAFTLFFSCLIGHPFIYPIFELTIMMAVYVYMHRRHESLCKQLREK